MWYEENVLCVRCWTPLLEPSKRAHTQCMPTITTCITCYIGWILKGFPTIPKGLFSHHFPYIINHPFQPIEGAHPPNCLTSQTFPPHLWDLANWNPRCHIRSPAFVASALVLHSVWPEAIQTFGESVGKRGSSKKWHQLQNKARFLGGNPKSLKATINSSIVWFPRNWSLLMIPGKQEMTSEYVWCLWRFFGDEDGSLKNLNSWIRKNWEKDFRKSMMFKINKTQQFEAKHLFSGIFWCEDRSPVAKRTVFWGGKSEVSFRSFLLTRCLETVAILCIIDRAGMPPCNPQKKTFEQWKKHLFV